MKQVQKLPVTILRGGTSKGVYILQSDLPTDKAEWEPILLRLMGSPDRKQIDGLGGFPVRNLQGRHHSEVRPSRRGRGLHLRAGLCG